jgi:uncharacterized membrane protein YjfL (UPF0719 family)
VLPRWRGGEAAMVAGRSEAMAIDYGAYYLAVLLCLGGAVSWASKDPAHGLPEALGFGLLAVLLLNASVLLAERTYLARWKLAEKIEAGHTGAALAEGAHYIALGLLILGASWGDSGGPAVMVCFWLLGQLFLWAALEAYLKIFRIDMPAQLEKGNLPAALSMAGSVVGFGNIARASVAGPFLGWGRSLPEAAGFFVFCFAALLGARWLADLWLFPDATFNKEIFGSAEPNKPAAVLDAMLFVGISVLLGWAIG